MIADRGADPQKRLGVYGWGIVAPKSPNVEVFRKNLACSESWLTPFDGFGPDNFLVGTPAFDFADYRSGNYAELSAGWPAQAARIKRLTRS